MVVFLLYEVVCVSYLAVLSVFEVVFFLFGISLHPPVVV